MNNVKRYLFAGLFIAFFDIGIDYPIMHWILFCLFANYSIYITIETFKISRRMQKIDIILIGLVSVFLCYLTIYKSYGWLIYPCIITISSMFIVIYFSFKSNSNNKYIKIKKIKLINKNRVKDKNNNEDKK